MTNNEQYRPYLVEYRHEGSDWGLRIQARSFEDAAERLRQLYYNGKVLGTVEAEIPAGPGIGWLVRAACWLRNTLKPGASDARRCG